MDAGQRTPQAAEHEIHHERQDHQLQRGRDGLFQNFRHGTVSGPRIAEIAAQQASRPQHELLVHGLFEASLLAQGFEALPIRLRAPIQIGGVTRT